MLAVGDLYQLPAVERPLVPHDQVFHSELWSEFRLFELTELVRTDADELELRTMLSHARMGWQALTEDDWALLEARVCANHCGNCDTFIDEMHVRPPGGRRADEVTITQTVMHCPCQVPPQHATVRQLREAPCLLAARRAKVNRLNEALHRPVGTVALEAGDTDEGGRRVTDGIIREQISDRLSGMPRRLALHLGMLVVITVNRRKQVPHCASCVCTLPCATLIRTPTLVTASRVRERSTGRGARHAHPTWRTRTDSRGGPLARRAGRRPARSRPSRAEHHTATRRYRVHALDVPADPRTCRHCGGFSHTHTALARHTARTPTHICCVYV